MSGRIRTNELEVGGEREQDRGIRRYYLRGCNYTKREDEAPSLCNHSTYGTVHEPPEGNQSK